MSETFYCTNCRVPIATLPLTEPVSCPKCGQSYWYQDDPPPVSNNVPVPPPPPPGWTAAKSEREKASSPAVATEPISRPPERSETLPTRPAHSFSTGRRQAANRLWQIFDWKFQNYLTPLIVRISWVISVVVAALWIVTILGALLLSMLPQPKRESSPLSADELLTSLESLDSLSGLQGLGLGGDSLLPRWMTSGVTRVLLAITGIAGIVLTVLWVRVGLETIVVIFNIAKTLTSIDKRIERQAEPE